MSGARWSVAGGWQGRVRRIAVLGAVVLFLATVPTSAPVFQILDIHATESAAGWRIQWAATPGLDYQLQCLTEDSGSGKWIPLATVRATAEVAFADDPSGPLVGQRIYRVIQITPGFRIIDVVRVESNGAFRIRWTSTPGWEYEVQRPADDRMPVGPPDEWVPVTTVQATGDVTSVDDSVPLPSGPGFYRVALMTGLTNDVFSPRVSFADAIFTTTDQGDPALQVRFRATDNLGVLGVRVKLGPVDLGPASSQGDNLWSLEFPVTLNVGSPFYLSAVAVDRTGNQAESDSVGLLPADPNLFSPVSATGQVLDNHALILSGGNQVADFVYRPGGRSTQEAAPDLLLRFPEGAAFAQVDGEWMLQFTDAMANFGPTSALQFTEPLSISGGATRQIGLGALEVSELAALFGLDPTVGLGVTVFDHIPILWQGGVLEDGGIRSPQFNLALLGSLPLPELSAYYEDFRLDSLDAFRIPFHGEFPLPDGSATPPRLRISPQNPLWLLISPDGRFSVQGRVEVIFADGGVFVAEMWFEDPVYRFAVSAGSREQAALGELAAQLPSVPPNCLPDTADPLQLDSATACLETVAAAYRSFNGAAIASSVSIQDLFTEDLSLPPNPFQGLAGGLEAWTRSALASAAGSLSLDAMDHLIQNYAQSSVTAIDSSTALQYWLALSRSFHAAESGHLTAGPDTLDQLRGALAQCESAAVRLLGESDLSLDADQVGSLLSTIAEGASLRQSLGLPLGQPLTDAGSDLVGRFVHSHAQSLGVRDGMFLPSPAILELDRATAMGYLNDVFDLLRDAEALSLPIDALPYRELLGQLGSHVFEQAEARLAAAGRSGDFYARLAALGDLIDLVQLREHAMFPDVPALNHLPDRSDLASYLGLINQIWQQDQQRPVTPATAHQRAVELSAWLKILRSGMASGLQADSFARMMDMTEALLADADADLGAIQSGADLLALLEVGGAHSELARHLGLTPETEWETARLPQFMDRLSEVAVQENAWFVPEQAAALMLDVAGHMSQLHEQALRQAYLVQASNGLATARTIGLALWHQAESYRIDPSPEDASDMVLPGGMEVSDASGAFSFHRITGEFAGSLAGRLLLPQFNGYLTLAEASVTRGGQYALSAHGQLTFTPEDSFVTVTVPSGSPMSISYSEDEGLQCEGSAAFQFANGIYFNASVSLLDPIYSFSMAAGGLEFDLLRGLAGRIPSFLEPPALDEEALEQWNNLYSSLAEAMAPVQDLQATSSGELRADGAGGSPLFAEFESVDAYTDLMLVDVLLGNSPDPSDVRVELTDIILNLGDELFASAESYAAFVALDPVSNEMNSVASDWESDSDPPFAPRVLQVDLGYSDLLYHDGGPAQYLELVPTNDTIWNAVGADVNAGLLFANGSPANGVSIDLGRMLYPDLANLSDQSSVIDWSFVPRPVLWPLVGAPHGDLLRDGVSVAHAPHDTGTCMATRIRGLGPGYFLVFAMPILPLPDDLSGPSVWSGDIHAQSARFRRFDMTTRQSSNPDGWEPMYDYAVGDARLADVGGEALILSRGSRALDGTWGQLLGFQLVESEPKIISFKASPRSIDLGESSTLSWDTLAAETVTIEPGEHNVAYTGTLSVSPKFTTRYLLSAKNSSGIRQYVVTVTVDGPERQFTNLAGDAAKLAKVYRKLAKSLQRASDAQLDPDIDKFVDLEAFKAVLDKATLEIYRNMLNNPQARRNLKTIALVAGTGQALEGTYQSLGLTGPEYPLWLLDEIIGFHDGSRVQYEQKLGYDRETGEVDWEVVGATSAKQSRRIIRDLLDLDADGDMQGSQMAHSAVLRQAYLDNLADKLLSSVGYDPATSTLDLSGAGESQLRNRGAEFLDVEFQAVAAGLSNKVPSVVYRLLGTELQNKALQNLQNLPAGAQWQRRFESVRNLDAGNRLLTQGGVTGSRYTQEIRAETLTALEQMQVSVGRARRFTQLQVELLTFSLPYLADPSFANAYGQRIETALLAIQALLADPWTTRQLKQGTPVLNELLTIHFLIKALEENGGGVATIAADLLPSSQIPKLRYRFLTRAEADRKLKMISSFTVALRTASRKTGLDLDEPLNDKRPVQDADPFSILLLEQSVASLHISSTVADGMLEEFRQAAPSLLPLDLALPGQVNVKRVFGDVYYNRETAFWRGSFGGRLEFPDHDAFFEVNEATLASDGSFVLDAETETPLPFGEDVRLTAGLTLTGEPDGAFTAAGQGQLEVPTDGDPQFFDVRLAYVSEDSRFSFLSTASNLNLRLCDDFVLFDSGFGFDVTTDDPAGAFHFLGSAGLFALEHPLPDTIGPTNFNLTISDLSTTFAYDASGVSVTLSNGTLHLPDLFSPGLCTNDPAFVTGPQVELDPAAPLQVDIPFEPPGSLSITGALDFSSLGFAIPGLSNFAVEVCSTRLVFPAGSPPVLSNVDARMTLPLPDQSVTVALTDLVWRLDGFPDAASVELLDPVRLLKHGGFSLDFQSGSGFGFTRAGPQTEFILTGGIRGAFSSDFLADADSNGDFTFGTEGSFAWRTDQLPEITLDDLSFAGRMKLGGTNGVEILGVDTNGIPDPDNPLSQATITLSGVANLFDLSPQRSFEVAISGAMGSAEFVYFGLGNSRFVFDGAAPDPHFLPGSIGFREGTQLALLGQELLPFRITAGSVTFLNSAVGWDELFAPQNLKLTLSGEVNISLTPPDSENPDLPRLYGAVEDVQIQLPQGFSAPPQFSLNSFTLALENLTIGDMAGLTGGLTVGNLNDPPNLFFAGTVGGGYNGVGIEAIVATRLDGLLGLCLSVDAGPAGIPLDGGAVGGILLTGAEGGVSFINEFADPCEFKSYLVLRDDGTPPDGAEGGDTGPAKAVHPPVSKLSVLTWDELNALQRIHEQTLAWRDIDSGKPFKEAGIEQADEVPPDATPCPTGDCPPATLNLLCQRHPSVAEEPSPENYDGRYRDDVIFKFSSLDRDTVDQLLADFGIDLGGEDAVVAGQFADAVQGWVSGLIPPPPPSLPPDVALEIEQFTDAGLLAMRDLVESAVLQALAMAPGTALDAIHEAAYAGVSCVDLTIQLKGTFSYLPVSVALSATGGAAASTTGSAGILGSVNLFGLPVGTGEFFYSLTDTNGLPNPSLCGGIVAALGPLEFGNLGLAIGCDECVTGTLVALHTFATGLGQELGSEAIALFRLFVMDAVGDRVPDLDTLPLDTLFGPPSSGAVLTQYEQIAVLTALFNLSNLQVFIDSHPDALDASLEQAIQALGEHTLQLVLAIYTSTNPRLSLCGEVQPNIFGFSLNGDNTLVGAQVYADKTRLAGTVEFSPSYIMGNLPFMLMSGGSVNSVLPALDEAVLGVGLGLPLVDEPTLRVMVNDPAAFAGTQLDHLLANAVLTFGYEIKPLGFELADAEGRIALPTLGDHPDNPARRLARPGDYINGEFVPPAFPDRAAVLEAALDAGLLANATWDGKGTSLADLFAPIGTNEANAVAGRELIRDYFPFGGFLGAGKVMFPRPMTDLPPVDDLGRLFAPNPQTNLLDRLQIAEQVFTDYVLGTREVGQLMTYIPFPRPPDVFWDAARGPQAFIDAISEADTDTLIANLDLYPADQLFMVGGVTGQVLGVALVDGELVADPATGVFELAAGIGDSWLTNFMNAQLTFEIRTASYIEGIDPANLPPGVTVADLQPEHRLQMAWDAVTAALQPGATPAQQTAALDEAVDRITDTLPKVFLQSTAAMQIPPELQHLLEAGVDTTLYAFSPRYEPGFPGVGPVADARRNGGIAFHGQFRFADLVTVDNVELAVTPAEEAPLPALSGLAQASAFSLVPGVNIQGALLQFNTDPGPNEPVLTAACDIDPIVLPLEPLGLEPILEILPLAPEDTTLSGRLDITETPGHALTTQLVIDPAAVRMPILGEGPTITIHGADPTLPFTFSTDGAWTGVVSIAGALCIRDLDGHDVACLDPGDWEARVTGFGPSLQEMAIHLRDGLALTIFPGTAHAYTLDLGADADLVISADGRFLLQSTLGGQLDLPNLGFDSIGIGSSFGLSNEGLTVSGYLSGGVLNHVNLPSVSGSLSVTYEGVSVSGSIDIPPFQMGAFVVSGSGGGNIAAQLLSTGLHLDTMAQVRINAPGYPAEDLFTLRDFSIEANGDFRVDASGGGLNLPGYFSVDQGSFTLIRSNLQARLEIAAPGVTLFPGKNFKSSMAPPISLLTVESTGRFYADTGARSITLPGGFSATGRLEMGYEPDPRSPALSVSASPIGFDTVNFGSSTTRTLLLSNPGDGPLRVSIISSDPQVYRVTPADLILEPGEATSPTIRFTPSGIGPFSRQLTLFHNASGGARYISLSGTGDSGPVLHVSDNAFDFGDVKLGNTETRILRVGNLGLETMTGSLALAGGGFAVSANSFTVPPGDHALVEVSFSPGAEATYSTTLQVDADDVPGGIRNVALDGVGYEGAWYLQDQAGRRLRSIAMNASGRGFAVGDRGVMLRTDNHGHAWEEVLLPNAVSLEAVAFAQDDDHGIAVGAVGRVYLTSDAGQTWRVHIPSVPRNDQIRWYAAAFVPGYYRHVLVGHDAVLQQGVVAVALVNSGSSYQVEYPTTRPITCGAIASVSGQIVALVGTENGRVHRSIDAGSHWSERLLSGGVGAVKGIALKTDGTALLVTSGGQVYESGNGGLAWTLRASGLGTLQAVAFGSSAAAYAINREGDIFRGLSFGGDPFIWRADEYGLGALYGLAASGSRAWAVGSGAKIFHRPGYPINNGILQFSPDTLDYGFVPTGSSQPLALRLHNRGLAPLSIAGFSPNKIPLADVAFSPAAPFTIPAGEDRLVNVYFSPHSDYTESDASISIYSSDPYGTQIADLRGRSASRGWVLKGPLPNGGGATAVDVQMVSQSTGYAITGNRFYITTDGGSTWTQRTTPPGGTLATLHFNTTTMGFIGGGTTGKFPTRFIARTTDGGQTWGTVHSGGGGAVVDLDFGDAKGSQGYATTAAFGTFPAMIEGVVLRTTNAGTSWTALTGPGIGFNGTAVHAVSVGELFVNNGGVLYRSTNQAVSWSPMLTNGTSRIRSISFYGSQRGYVVGDGGTLWRTLVGGDTPVEWSPVSAGAFAGNDLNRVHFRDTNVGWITPSSGIGQAAIYRSDDGGASWRDELGESPVAGDGSLVSAVVSAYSATDAVALGTEGSVRRYQAYVPEPLAKLAVAPVLDFGSARVGSRVTRSLNLRNIGGAMLTISGLAVDGVPEGTEDFLVISRPPFTIAAGGSLDIQLRATHRVAGSAHGILSVVTDGAPPASNVELRSVTPAEPAVVVFDTDPPGLQLRIDGQTVTAPMAFTIRDGASGPSEWAPDSSHTIEAIASQAVSGQGYGFVGWTPSRDRTFTYTAEGVSQTFSATHVPSDDVASGTGEHTTSAPAGVTTGPYLRLSGPSPGTDAVLSHPHLGDLKLSGAALLSEDMIDVSLQSGGFAVRPLATQPELAAMSAGSWHFLYDNDTVQLRAQTPSVTLLGRPVKPSAGLSLTFEPSGHFAGTLDLPKGWAVAPGFLEFGPGSSTTIAYDGEYRIDASGQIRALRKPDGTTWAYAQTGSMSFGTGAFTNTVPLPSSSLMRLYLPGTSVEFLEVHGGSSSGLDLRRNNQGTYSARLQNIGLDVMGRYLGSFSPSANSQGLLTFSASPPGSGYIIGPFRWHAGGSSTLSWNIRTGALTFDLAGGTLKDSGSSVPGWPDNGLSVPALSFDSQGDFEKTIPLPSSFVFDGIGLGQADDTEDRYVTLKRVDGVLSLRLRDRREFFGSSMSLGFNVNSAGNASGFFSGSFGVDFPWPIGHVHFGDVNIAYDPDGDPYQFRQQLRIAGNDFRIKFGAGQGGGTGKVCWLWCDDDGCTENICLP